MRCRFIRRLSDDSRECGRERVGEWRREGCKEGGRERQGDGNTRDKEREGEIEIEIGRER